MTQLDANRIARAALAVIGEKGVDGFSMRAVARILNVTPMALYHHVADKATLARLTVEAAMQEVPLPAAQGDWRDDLLAMANWVRQVSKANPEVAKLRRTYQVWLPSMSELAAHWLSIWQSSGLDTEQATTAATTSMMAIVGVVEVEINMQHLPMPDEAALSQIPHLRTVFTASRDADGRFRLLVLSLINGLYERLRADSGNKSR